MKKNQGRRDFIKNVGLGGTMAFIPLNVLKISGDEPETQPAAPQYRPNPSEKRAYHTPYTGEFLNRIAFPVGGLGAGMFCIEGTGAISHVSVRNQPDIFNDPGIFAAISVRNKAYGAKVLEGPVPDWKKFGLRDAGNGLGGWTTGLPHFHSASFRTKFPFCHIGLKDKDLPLSVELTGWSPFIPADEDNSGLPAGAVEYRFTNTGSESIDAVFSFNTHNFLRIDNGKNAISSMQGGFILSEAGTKEKPYPTDFAVFTDEDDVSVDHCWFRGGWWDPMTMAWNAVKDGDVKSNPPVPQDAPGASLYVPFSLKPGGQKTIRVMMAWYTPDSEITYGKMGTRKENCSPADGCCNTPADLDLDKYDKGFTGRYYKPWYSSRFGSITEVAEYWKRHYDDLRKKSALFSKAFYNTTLPPEVTEAVAANLTILKSPTVMRQYDGRLWSFEGCGDSWGCCHGSCTHVWTYAQAVPHLFPALERSLRHTEFCEDQDESGHQNFRANLPIEPTTHDFHAAADGQLGGIMKVYREWRISGDNNWAKKMYPMVKVSMDYCIRTWDPRHKGVIEEPHHNTYDIEFWGPDGMHTSFYIGALNAISAMGESLGNDMSLYRDLAAKGKVMLEGELYDGEYFIQKITVSGLNAKNPATELSYGGDYSAEAKALLEKEGPKYQYGKGCLSDGILGAWIGRMCMVPETIDPEKIKSHVLAVHRYNFKKDLSEHANPQRPSYALGNEAGLLLCTWPKGGKLSLPFVYSDEVWTGIEHQIASHLMLTGSVQQGLDIVRASRDRYDGRIRNPFNEYECGNWYARAMSSYGYLQALTGVRYDAVTKTLYVDSKVGDFTVFLSTETGFGNVSLKNGHVKVDVVHGSIPVSRIMTGAA
ncbi:MAG TPA: GH116 family glycosyl hydrolase [Mucilaginibacter sp.]|nr:GH116 family glycosyl hydrolase [Mucilaginibacter sp.]